MPNRGELSRMSKIGVDKSDVKLCGGRLNQMSKSGVKSDAK